MNYIKIIYALFFLSLASCSGVNGQYAASVNGERVSMQEFQSELRAALARYSLESLKDPRKPAEIKASVLERMIKSRLLYAKAKESGIKISQEDIDRELNDFRSRYTEATFKKMLELKGIGYKDWEESVKRSLFIDELAKRHVLAEKQVSESDIKNYYNRHKKKFQRPEEVHVRQILVEDPSLAESLRKQALEGRIFSELALEHSIAPESRKGGDLGWFPRGVMPKEFDEACFKLKTGEISPIVKTEFGYHLFKLVEKRGAAEIPLEKAGKRIASMIEQERTNGDFERWYLEQRAAAKVEINERAIADVDPRPEGPVHGGEK